MDEWQWGRRVVRVFLTGSALAGIAHACASDVMHACADDAAVAASASGLRELRSNKGHFSGGSWTPAVDAWGGAKHRALQCLGTHAAARRLPAAQARTLLGAPDERLPCPSADCSALLGRVEWPASGTPVAPTELWLYHWRGRHDRLLLAVDAAGVQASGWLHDLE